MSEDTTKRTLSRRRFIQGLGAAAGLVAAPALIAGRTKEPEVGSELFSLASLRPNNSCRCVKFSRGEFRLDEELLAGLLELAHGRGDRSIWRRGAAVEQLG